MVYVSNADVFYKRKKNPYKGAATSGSGYGYGKLASTLLKAYVGGKKKTSLKGKLKRKGGSMTSLTAKKTRTGFEVQEGANSLTKCNFGMHRASIPQSVLSNLQSQFYASNYAENALTTVGLQDYKEIPFFDPGTIGVLHDFAIYKNLFLESFNGEINMVNASSTNSVVTLYDIVCKGDCSSAGKNSSPGVAWSYGVDQEGGSSTDYKVIGSVPTDSYMFNKFYKIVQKTRVSMAPGQMHRHQVTFRPQRKVQGFWVDAAPYGLANTTCWTLIVHHGSPAHDSTTNTSVTIDVSSLDIVRKYTYAYKFLEDSNANWQKTNNLATTFAVGEQFVNEAVGQVQDAGGLHPGTLHA